MKFFITLIGLLSLMSVAHSQSLQACIEEAEQNNPGIQAFELKYQVSKEKVNEAGALPNTEIGIGYFVQEPETRTGAQKARFSGRQMFPWFGTIATREDLAESMSHTEYLDWVIAKRRIALQVGQVYHRLVGLRAKDKVLKENIRLLRTYEDLALKSVEVGRASAVDVLRLQIRQNELEQQVRVLLQSDAAATARLNGLMNRSFEDVITTYEINSLPNSDEYKKDSLELNPEILRFDALYESVVQEELVNQKQQLPMFGLGIDYLPVEKRNDMAIMDNGKDIIMPMIALSVPLFNSSYRSQSKQNELRQDEIVFQKAERQNILGTALAEAEAKRKNARIIYETQTENLMRAKDAEELLLKSYETGTIDFNDVLNIQEIQLKIHLGRIDAITAYYEQLMLIEYLTQ